MVSTSAVGIVLMVPRGITRQQSTIHQQRFPHPPTLSITTSTNQGDGGPHDRRGIPVLGPVEDWLAG